MAVPPAPQYGYPVAYPAIDTRPRLDRLISRMRRHDPAPWGWRPVVLPCAALVVLTATASLLGHVLHPHAAAAVLTAFVANAVLEGALVVVIVFAGRDLARRYAGWGWTYGLQRPRWMDGAWLAAGVGMVLGSRLVIVLIADALTDGRAAEESQNLTARSHSGAAVVLLAVFAVGVAPIVEETVFRGLLLRTFMWHWGFWRAALASSAIFAAFHLYQVDTFAGAATLGSIIFALGLANCLLVRWSGRLAAGIMVHALFNALAVLVFALR